ncbi:MAG TPA: hypothetical protein PKJ63_05040 [Cyclobacteriaceae bacterium]|nr:hypothetical protein [Cyclobacteriaceae bacterium]
MRLVIVVLILLLPQVTKPQSVSTLMGARSGALGNASSALSDGWSFHNNFAGIANSTQTLVNFAYSVPPALPGANRAAFSLVAPIKSFGAGVGLFRFGDEVYSEQILSAAIGNRFGLASLGIKANYVQYSAEGFGTRNALTLDFGGIAELSDKISIGAMITNISQSKLRSNVEERLPTRMTTGVQFRPDGNLTLLIELEKDLVYDPTFKAGIEYEFYQKFFARTGFNLNPNIICGGLGYRSSKLSVDYAMQYAHSIQTQFQLSVTYRIIKQSSKS